MTSQTQAQGAWSRRDEGLVACKKAAALLDLGQEAEAAKCIWQACKQHDYRQTCEADVVQLLLRLSTEWQAQYWEDLIRKAESPNPISARDGKLLRRVPLEAQLTREVFAKHMRTLLASRLGGDSITMISEAWLSGRVPGKAAVAVMRSYTYLQAQQWNQALRDAKFGAAFGPNEKGRCCWPRALAAMSSAIEGSQANNTEAAFLMKRAIELQPGNLEFLADIDRLLRRIPEPYADVLQAGGSAALERLLAQEREDALPEFRKNRPKYYYYYKWMREQVTQHCGELPPPVLEKVVRIDATELEMLLTYPKGIKRQAGKLLDAYNEGGDEALLAYRLPLLTYQESEELKAEHARLALEASSGSEAPQLTKLESIIEEEDLDAIEPLDI